MKQHNGNTELSEQKMVEINLQEITENAAQEEVEISIQEPEAGHHDQSWSPLH